jgi:hypothetical protein
MAISDTAIHFLRVDNNRKKYIFWAATIGPDDLLL